MADEKRQLKVFLCHSHSDKSTVRELYFRLIQDGVDAWLDKEKLLPGQDWEMEIRKAVREADVVVVCLSKHFNQAGFRQKEVRLALDTAMEQPEGEIFLIPARLDECDTLESLRKWHWVDLFEGDGYEMLMRALQSRAQRIGAILQIPRTETKRSKHKINPKQLVARKGLMFLGVIALLTMGLSFWNLVTQKNKPTSIMKNTLIPTTHADVTNQPSVETDETSTITITPKESFTPSVTFTVSPLITEITDSKGVSMVLVPRGEFTMGSSIGEPSEMPPHLVYLDNYYIDKFEVTNALYKVCVDQGKCGLPFKVIDFNNPDYSQNPVVFIDWSPASQYCEWRGAHLPTEAEWEKAARGIDERTYPWGEGISEMYANYDGYVAGGKTTPVGQYERGKSIYGAYDLAGNVWEWVADWYAEDYYSISPSSGPHGPRTGNYRVVRGGAFDSKEELVRTFSRTWFYANQSNSSIGFRCAMDAIP